MKNCFHLFLQFNLRRYSLARIFRNSAFNQDISKWNVISVTDAAGWYISRVSETFV